MSESVLKRIARGDERAVAQCMDEFGNLVWALARRLSRTRADAEDAVQEIFTDLWRSAGRFDPEQGSEKVFVTTIARRRLIDRMRRSAHQPGGESVDSLDVIGWAEPGTRAEVCVEAERAARAVARLRPEQQKVLELGILGGLTHSEIAAATGMPLGTVKTNMRRGLIQVREMMDVVVDEPAGALQP
ncbi:MAG TPA: sigma-70 family RNA polymerase sigma factor [Steroidobacteraceae bacterium]|nr:sigma-70 family RNA polymerase sigma factor [Steroidobacteraceae bacterium]